MVYMNYMVCDMFPSSPAMKYHLVSFRQNGSFGKVLSTMFLVWDSIVVGKPRGDFLA